jgi:hypothetical protein
VHYQKLVKRRPFLFKCLLWSYYVIVPSNFFLS